MSKRLKFFTVASTLALSAAASHASTLTCDFNSYKPTGVESYASGSTFDCGDAKDALVLRATSSSSSFSFGLAAADAATYPGLVSASTYAVGQNFGFGISGAKAGSVVVDQFSFSIAVPATDLIDFSYSINGGKQQSVQMPKPGADPVWFAVQLVNVGEAIETVDFFSTRDSNPSPVLIDNLVLSLRDVPAVVPEPAGYGLTLAALMGAFVATSRRRRAR